MTLTQNTEQLEDELLVTKIVESNDTHLFGLLYDRYAAVVYNKVLSFVSSREEAQDVTHDIFVKLFVKLKLFKGESKFSTWLYAFTYNYCVNYLNRVMKNQKKTTQIDENVGEEILDEIPDEQIHKMKAEKLSKALQLISPDEKAILLMKYQDDVKIKEIANAYEISESAVKMRLTRAKLNLTELYKTL